MENCGLTGYGAGRLTRAPELFGKQHFLTNTSEDVWKLKPDAEKQKNKLIEQYTSEFDPTPYIVANMLSAITGED